MFKLSEIVKDWKESGALQAHINLYGFWDEETFLTKSGDLGMVLRVKGIDYESLDRASRDHAVKRLEAASRAFDSRVWVYQALLKANEPAIPHREYTNPLVKAAIDQRMAYFAAKADQLYVVISPSLPIASGSGYSVPFGWSDVSPQACNAGITYRFAVSNNGQLFSTSSVTSTSLNLTIPTPLPTGLGLTGWTWTVTAVDPFGNKTQSGTGTFSLQLPVSIPPPDLTITKTASPSPVTSGGTLTYTITAQNAAGTAAAQNVTVTDPLPTGVSFTSCSVSTGGCSALNGHRNRAFRNSGGRRERHSDYQFQRTNRHKLHDRN